MTTNTIPEDFKPYCTDNTFNDVVAPLYVKMGENGPVLGMHIEKKHCNYVGFAHGGCLMTFMDIALSGAVCHKLGKYTSTPTINISFDFMATAKEGEWISAELLSVNLTRTMGFVNAVIEGPNGTVANVSGCFKLPADINAYPGMDAEEYIQWRTTNTE